jgi:hypothetical protein
LPGWFAQLLAARIIARHREIDAQLLAGCVKLRRRVAIALQLLERAGNIKEV